MIRRGNSPPLAAFTLGAAVFALGITACRTSPPAEARPEVQDFARVEIAAGQDLRNESFGARRVVRVGDTSFIGYSELAGGTWHVRVRAYDHRKHVLGPVCEVASGTDDHSIMALAADSRGVLHCVSGGHGAVVYTHTIRPAEATSWTGLEAVSPEGTYNMMVIDREDRLYVFYRREWVNLEMRSRPAGGPWDPPVHIASTTGNKGFYIMGIALGNEPGRQSLHVVGHFYGEPEAYGLAWPKENYGYRIRPWYICSLDSGETWGKADGTALPLPFPDTAIDVLFDRNQPYDIPWSVDIALDPDNRPHVFCAWSDRLPAPGLTLREVQAEIGRRLSRLQEWTWEDGQWRSRDVATPSLAGRHVSHPTAIFAGETVHLFASTSEAAAARQTGEATVGRLWHGWSRGPGLWGEEILDEGTGYANVKLPDASGFLEVLWRGKPKAEGRDVALHYAAWPAAAFRASNAPGVSLREVSLVIPQVDYEGALFRTAGDPYPHVDLSAVPKDRIVDKSHRAMVLENEYIKLTLLPSMGRVYSFVYKPSGHEVFWKNDIVTVGGAQNAAGWWIWIGGAEYTLPGDEHGTTWAEPWTSSILEDSDRRKAVRMAVLEPGTGLREEIDISLDPGCAGFEARVRIINPTQQTVHYAHWINPQWAPGGWNELTDKTEFIIPTEDILIPERFRAALGPSPQRWATSPLRFIKGWDKGWGDLMAGGLQEGFFGAYSHDEQEGVVRVFDKDLNPGVDVWTYGFHPKPPGQIPMGSGAPNRGYVEMWGGTSKTFPDERKPLGPGESIEWTEWMAPFHLTGGLTTADRNFAVYFSPDAEAVSQSHCEGAKRPKQSDAVAASAAWRSHGIRWDHHGFFQKPRDAPPGRIAALPRVARNDEWQWRPNLTGGGRGRLAVCPARALTGLRIRLTSSGRVLWEGRASMSPDRPFEALIDGLGDVRPLTLIIEAGRRILLKKDLAPFWE